ncbi:MAG: hypothetical protein ACNFW9_00995 [Candidatus Kerfeldbacteria bacterium]|jgi:hypothetical protein
MPGELREIRESVEKAEKPKKEIEMMADSAKNDLWVEVSQGEVSSASILDGKDGFTDESREVMNAQIMQIRELFNQAVEKLGDGEGESEDVGDGLLKGLERGYVEMLEKKISDLELVL